MTLNPKVVQCSVDSYGRKIAAFTRMCDNVSRKIEHREHCLRIC